MNYDCPFCGEDLEEYTDKNDISPYGHVFKCPNCSKYIKTGYDESWDGKEELGYYWLERVEQC